MYVGEETEREHMRLAISSVERMTGQRPLGWFTGRLSMHTRRLVVEEGGFLYDADSYCDDLPCWVTVEGKDHLVIPYTLEANDMLFSGGRGFSSGDQFFTYLKDTFDMLYAEGADRPKMMSVGLHCRLAGRPGRAGAHWRASSTMSRATTRCGCAAASTSRATGARGIHRDERSTDWRSLRRRSRHLSR